MMNTMSPLEVILPVSVDGTIWDVLISRIDIEEEIK